MNFNKIIVIGAGVIGSCYGALLSEKNPVLMVDNNEIVDKINKMGITIITDGEKKFFPTAKTQLEEIEQNTLILLTTKAHQSKDAIQPIKNLFRDDTAILILQNGMGNKEIVRKIVGDKIEVIRGIVNIGAGQIEPSKFNLILKETVFEPTNTGGVIAKIFNVSGIPARISQNFISELWQKLALNCVLNPLTAILKVRNYQIAVPVLKELRHQIVKECISVSKAEGINLPADLAQKIDNAIQGYTNFSSMYQDVVKGKTTEIDFLNGRIVELAHKHKILTPCNEALTAIIKFMEPKNET